MLLNLFLKPLVFKMQLKENLVSPVPAMLHQTSSKSHHFASAEYI